MMAAAESDGEPTTEEDKSDGEEPKTEWDWGGMWICTVRNCTCSWRPFSWTDRVAPGRDHISIPAADAADHHPAWSVLVGLKDGAVLRLKRLRVARSGRILGRSDDELEFFHEMDTPTGYGASASAALAPDARSLCLLRQAHGEKPQAMLLRTHKDEELRLCGLPLPEIQETDRCMAISVGGSIYALSATLSGNDDCFTLRMRRSIALPDNNDDENGGCQWQQIGDAFTKPCKIKQFPKRGRWFLEGYAELPGTNLILVSFNRRALFCTFATDSGEWTLVPTDAARWLDYVSILGRAECIDQDQALYMLHGNKIYSYKLTYYQDDQGRQQLTRLDPPTKIASVCPFDPVKGYGFLAPLHDRLMCSVWISLAWREPCLCDHLHAIVTTFNLCDPAMGGGGIHVLHSSFRWLDIKPNPEDQEFCFLLGYDDEESPLLFQHQGQEDLTTSQHVDGDPSMMPACCREDATRICEPGICFLCGAEGHIASNCCVPPQDRPLVMPIDPASMQHQVSFSSRRVCGVPLNAATTTIKKNLLIICQADSKQVIYQTRVMDESSMLEGDNGKPLEPSLYPNDGVNHLHFFETGSKIQAVLSLTGGMLECSLNKDRPTITQPPTRNHRIADPFVMVIRVGGEAIAVTETLQVFHQTLRYGSTCRWLRYRTNQSDVLRRKVLISGYVAVNDHSFLVWDGVACSGLLFDLGVKEWRVVMPWPAFAEELTGLRNCVLNGRCVSVDGFIYTCIDGGLAALQLLRKDHSVFLSKPIDLKFSWEPDCVGEYMCLDYAGKDVDSGAIFFCVVQDGYYPLGMQEVHITLVQVKTKARPKSKRRKPARVELVERITRSIRHTEAFYASCCFAVS